MQKTSIRKKNGILYVLLKTFDIFCGNLLFKLILKLINHQIATNYMAKTYIFDLDEIVIDSKLYKGIISRILERIKKNKNLSDDDILKKAKEMNLTDNIFDLGKLCKELNATEIYLYEIEKKISIISMLKENLVYLFKGLKLKDKKIIVVSNLDLEAIKLFLDKYSISMFTDIIFSQNFANSYKDTKIFYQKLIEQNSIVPNDCIIVGKNILEDVTIPKSLGFNTYYVSSSFDLTQILNRD
jgi:FMN phosphatase YigB (HAD superfamily)